MESEKVSTTIDKTGLYVITLAKMSGIVRRVLTRVGFKNAEKRETREKPSFPGTRTDDKHRSLYLVSTRFDSYLNTIKNSTCTLRTPFYDLTLRVW